MSTFIMSIRLRDIFDIGLALIETYGWWLAGVSLVMILASILVLRILLVRIPADYFVRETPLLAGLQHPAWEVLLLVLKNVVGFILVLLGLIMSLPGVAGQGILTILAGLSLMNFPGKRKLQRLIVMQPLIQRTIDGIRVRAGQPPLDLDGIDEDPRGKAGQ